MTGRRQAWHRDKTRTGRLVVVGLVAAISGLAAACTPTDSSRTSPPEASRDDVAALVRRDVATGAVPGMGEFTSAEQADAGTLYAQLPPPVWLDDASRPTADAHDALTLLDHVNEDGLDPTEYPAAALQQMASTLDHAARPAGRVAAAFDAGMSLAMLRYFRQVHLGRVDAQSAGFNLIAPPEPHDFGVLLAAALAHHQLTAAAADLEPPLAQYHQLRRALTMYRSIAADSSIPQVPAPAHTVHPGDPYAGVRALYRRLVAVGDLPPDSPPPASQVYEGSLVGGVTHFQRRHGLTPDGVIGSGTAKALAVPPGWRVRQIELALERLRWLPDLTPAPLVVINVPMFHLWAWDQTPVSGPPAVQMDVIVGNAMNTQTPVLVATLRDVIFRPYWNVPRSIVRHEVLPAIARTPDYFSKNAMELVDGQRDDSAVVPPTPANIGRLRQGEVRIRQRPGPKNSLGLVKFVFPNVEDVYMHGTPAPQLFTRARRDFSHGCVRVADPVALADWVLKNQADWPPDRIGAAMTGTTTIRVAVARPIQVILFYNTAAVMPDDGTVHFADDIYGQDTRLNEALTSRSQAGN